MTTTSDRDIRIALGKFADREHDANVRDPPSLHPFPARMPAPLAEHLLRSLLARKSTVLDPMVGSGSTLIAARKLGHRGYGVDIDPLAILISRIATTSYKRQALLGLQARVLKRAVEIRSDLSRASIASQLGSPIEFTMTAFAPSPAATSALRFKSSESSDQKTLSYTTSGDISRAT